MNEILPLLYQDDYFVAVHKPSGLLVHRSEIDRSETRFALQIVRNQIGQHVYPLHRLDKPTSGVLLFALSADVARAMMAVFGNNHVDKDYLAVVRGYFPERVELDYPLKEELDKTTDARAQQDKAPQAARTDFECLRTVELPFAVGRYAQSRYSLVRATPHTGRKHQIRRHLKHLFHPIVGDTTHGDGKHNQLFREQLNCSRLLLASTRLGFTHPITQQYVEIQAPLADIYQQIALQLFAWP